MVKTIGFLAALALAGGASCKKDEKKDGDSGKMTEGAPAKGEGGGEVAGDIIQLDGSSTVSPISQAVAEEFQKKNSGARVTVGVSGTGGGFKKFCRGEIAVADASRPIKDEEQAACKSGGIDYIELPVAYDGIAVVVHKGNAWVDHLTVDELKTMWAPEAQGKVMKWSQVRKGWPDKDLHLFGPGVNSGTYEYFTKAIVGKEKSSRGDFSSSEDDNVLVQGVSSDEGALGYFGLAYYVENQDKLKLVPIDDGVDDDGKGPIVPSQETVANSTYQPLSRPIFIYVSTKALDRPEVKAFAEFYLNQAPTLVPESNYIALPATAYELARKRLAEGKTGTTFHGSKVGVKVEDLLAQ